MDSFVIIRLADQGAGAVNIRKHKNIQKYLLKKLPAGISDMVYCKEHGRCVELPFSKETIELFEREFVEAYIEKLIEVHDLSNIYLDRELSCCLDKKASYPVWLLSYMVMPEMIRYALVKGGLDCRDLHPVVFDPGDVRCDYILEWLVPKVNYLTIVTERKEYFNDFCELVYEHMGLVAEVCSYPVREPLAGRLIIDANASFFKLYQYAEENAAVVELDGSTEKTNYYTARRKDLIWIREPSVTMNGEPVDNRELAVRILMGKSWRLSQFARCRCNMFYGGDMELLADLYQIRYVRPDSAALFSADS